MSTHKVCFYVEIRKIIPQLSPNDSYFINKSTGAHSFICSECHTYLFRGWMKLHEKQHQKYTFRHVLPADSDWPVHSCSLIRIFNGCALDSQGLKSISQRTMKTDCTDVQADLNLCWALVSDGTFSRCISHIKRHGAYINKIIIPFTNSFIALS